MCSHGVHRLNADCSLGTLLVGIWFNTYLYGIVTYQFAAYWRTRVLCPPLPSYGFDDDHNSIQGCDTRQVRLVMS